MYKSLAIACGLATLMAATLRADLVVRNLANTTDGTALVDDFDAGGFAFGTTFQAQSFTTGAGALTLEKVTLSMAASPLGMGGFAVEIYDNTGAGGLPGTSLTSLIGDSDPDVAGVYDYTPGAVFSFSAGTTYWVVASASAPPAPVTATGFLWNTTSDTSETGDAGWSIGNSAAARLISSTSTPIDTGWVFSGSPLQMSVSAIPEPSSVAFGCLMCVLIGATAVCRRACTNGRRDRRRLSASTVR